jgi:hypothetical protein
MPVSRPIAELLLPLPAVQVAMLREASPRVAALVGHVMDGLELHLALQPIGEQADGSSGEDDEGEEDAM